MTFLLEDSKCDYTVRGEAKIREQAKRNLKYIRCSLDSAIMLVTGSLASKQREDGVEKRRFGGRPPKSWTAITVDLECSACRRRIEGLQIP
ncbi:MAG: hypothetical protein ACE5HT_15695 [Gemmatimonadales bacterium]